MPRRQEPGATAHARRRLNSKPKTLASRLVDVSVSVASRTDPATKNKRHENCFKLTKNSTVVVVNLEEFFHNKYKVCAVMFFWCLVRIINGGGVELS